MIRVLILAFLLCFSCFAEISFQRESVTATISACDTFEIEGVYYFVNNNTTPDSTTIFYPFPVDSTLASPHYISVVRLANRTLVPFVQKTSGITWKQKVLPGATDSVRVVYRQQARHQCGRYILTTTQNWKKPLERAEFKVILPKEITLAFWTLTADSVWMKDQRMIYRSLQKNFFPTDDMRMEWRCEPAVR